MPRHPRRRGLPTHIKRRRARVFTQIAVVTVLVSTVVVVVAHHARLWRTMGVLFLPLLIISLLALTGQLFAESRTMNPKWMRLPLEAAPSSMQ